MRRLTPRTPPRRAFGSLANVTRRSIGLAPAGMASGETWAKKLGSQAAPTPARGLRIARERHQAIDRLGAGRNGLREDLGEEARLEGRHHLGDGGVEIHR